jgi:hypothetical protein
VEDVDRHGNVRLYFRRKGHKKLRLHSAIGTPEFEIEYQCALAASETCLLKATSARSEKTYRWLCHQFFQSADFRRLGPGTQRTRRLILEHTWDEPIAPGSKTLIGDCPLERMSAKIVRVLRDRKADFPHAANGRVKTIRRVFKWAIESEQVESNPARDVAYLSTHAGGQRTWTDTDITNFEARWPIGTKERLAFALKRYLGVRRSDAVRLGRQHVRDG